MIMRRGQGSRRRINQGRPPGRGIRTNASTLTWNKTRASPNVIATLFHVADYVFVTSFQLCHKLHILPYKMRENGTLVVNTRWKDILLHWAVLIAYAALMAQKLMAFVHQTRDSETLNVETLTSLALLMGYAGPVCFSVSTLLKKEETCELVNIWSHFIHQFIPSAIDSQAKMPNVQTAVEILAMVPVLALLAIALPTTTAIFRGIPGSFLFAAEEVGLIPAIPCIPHLVWRMLFWPLEMAAFCPLVLLILCTAMIVTRGLQVAFTCTSDLRYLFAHSCQPNASAIARSFMLISCLQKNQDQGWGGSTQSVAEISVFSDLRCITE